MAYDYLEVLGIEIGYISNGAYIPLRMGSLCPVFFLPWDFFISIIKTQKKV